MIDTKQNLFKTMNLPTALARALDSMGFVTPTAIQEKGIPIALSNRDLIGCAQTGTGKTAAFAIPTLARLIRLPQKSALVLAPTRELALQISQVLKQLTQHLPNLQPCLITGGTALQPQVRFLAKKPRLIVATPGRLVDHLRHGTLSLFSIETLVLDEADRMLDMGFAPQLNEILRFLPKTRQTLLFSATIPNHIEKLAARFLKDPVRVTVGPTARPVEKIKQTIVKTTHAKKNDVLLDELNEREGAILIFVRTKRRTDRVARTLADYGHSVARIHGDRSQSQRNSAIAGFRSGEYRILVATDIAARGLDIPHIAHVINYDLPQQPEDYVHRIGRTARAGADGHSLCLLLPEDHSQWQKIHRLTQSAAKVH